jgi:hypothetical protein
MPFRDLAEEALAKKSAGASGVERHDGVTDLRRLPTLPPRSPMGVEGVIRWPLRNRAEHAKVNA